MGKPHYRLRLSIAMLNYQRVDECINQGMCGRRRSGDFALSRRGMHSEVRIEFAGRTITYDNYVMVCLLLTN